MNKAGWLIAAIMLTSSCTQPSARPRVVSTPLSAVPVMPAEHSCELGDPHAALGRSTERESRSIIDELGTGVEAYRLQDGVWLEHAPVLINEDFDFGTAMGLGAMGAGLAAKQRADHNAAHAQELAGLALPDKARQLLDDLRACGVHRWVLLWKGPQTVARVVTELYDRDGKRVSTIAQEVPDVTLTSDELWRLVSAPQ